MIARKNSSSYYLQIEALRENGEIDPEYYGDSTLGMKWGDNKSILQIKNQFAIGDYQSILGTQLSPQLWKKIRFQQEYLAQRIEDFYEQPEAILYVQHVQAKGKRKWFLFLTFDKEEGTIESFYAQTPVKPLSKSSSGKSLIKRVSSKSFSTKASHVPLLDEE